MILNDWGNVVNKYRLITENHFQKIKFDSFVIMPNHFHVIIKIIGVGFNATGAGFPCHKNDKIQNVDTETPNAKYKNQNANNANDKNHNTGTEHADITVRNQDVYNANMRGNLAPTLGQIVGFFKYGVSKQINKIRETPGVKLWQRNYYEHIIRDNNEHDRIVKYIENNPKKWELDFLN